MKIISQYFNIILDSSVTEIRCQGCNIDAYSMNGSKIPLGQYLSDDIASAEMDYIINALEEGQKIYYMGGADGMS